MKYFSEETRRKMRRILAMQDRTKPTQAQIDYATKLMRETGYDGYDVHDIFGKDFADLTRGEMARLIDDLKHELEG